MRVRGALAFGALITPMTTLIPRAARAQGVDCVLDSECPVAHRCIDLVCVPATPREHSVQPGAQSSARPTPELTPAGTENGTENRPPPRSPPGLAYRPWSVKPPKPSSDTGAAPKLDAPRRRRWYGGPLIATYSLTAVVGTATFASDGNGSLLFLTVFSSPTVHWANGKLGKGFLSVLMQPVAAGAGYVLAANSPENSVRTSAALIGYALWAAVDVAALAYKSPPEPKVPETARVGLGLFRVPRGGGAEVFGVW
jgi:hypothetical protein